MFSRGLTVRGLFFFVDRQWGELLVRAILLVVIINEYDHAVGCNCCCDYATYSHL